jgi:hypothetical protein
MESIAGINRVLEQAGSVAPWAAHRADRMPPARLRRRPHVIEEMGCRMAFGLKLIRSMVALIF